MCNRELSPKLLEKFYQQTQCKIVEIEQFSKNVVFWGNLLKNSRIHNNSKTPPPPPTPIVLGVRGGGAPRQNRLFMTLT